MGLIRNRYTQRTQAEINSFKKRLFTILLIFILILQYIPRTRAAEDKVVNLEVLVDKSNVLVGENFTYTIKYSYSSNNVNFDGEKINVTLPTEMSVVSYEGSADVDSVNTSNNNGQTNVDFIMKNNISAGTTGYMTLTSVYPVASLDAPTSGTISVTGGNGTDTFADPVEPTVNVTLHNTFDWSVTKTRTSPSIQVNPVVGSNVTYKINIAGNTGVGGFNIHNVSIIDSLPEEAVYISSNPSATSVNGQIVQWDIGDLNAGSSTSVYVTVNYPDTFVNTNDTVRNNVSVSGNSIQDDPATSNTISAFTDVTFSDPSPSLRQDVAKYSRDYDAQTAFTADEYSPAQTIQYSIRNIGNTGNVSLDTIKVYDLVPEGIIVKTAQLQGGTLYYTHLDRATIADDYNNIQSNDWIIWDGNSAVDSEITGLRWIFSDVPEVSTIGNINITAVFNNNVLPNKDTPYLNSIYVDGYAEDYIGVDTDPLTNDPNLPDYDTAFSGTTVSDVAYIKCVDELPWITVTKTASPTSVYESDSVTYTISLKNNSNATGSIAPEDQLTLIDTLPLLSGDPILGNMVVASEAHLSSLINSDPGYLNGDVTTATFDISGITLNPGETYTFTYSVKVKDSVRVGTYTNFIAGTFTDSDLIGKVGNRVNDLTDSTSIQVRFKGSLKSVKGIGYNLFSNTDHTNYLLTDPTNNNEVIVESATGQILAENINYPALPETPGSSFYRSPSGNFSMPMGTAIVNATVAGGVVRYRLEVSNDNANGPISNIVLIDKLPKIGDTGLVVSSSRGSGWSPYLVSEVTGKDNTSLLSLINDNVNYNISDIQVFYSTKSDPSLSQLSQPTTRYYTDHDNGDWTTSLPENITDITYIKIQIDGNFEPGTQAATFEWDMRAPYDAPDNLIAWNSFAYGATYLSPTNTQEPFLPAEPIKVGIRIEPTTITAPINGRLGNFIWEDLDKNGIQDIGEQGINNITVRLYKDSNNDNVIDATELNATPFDQTVTGYDQSGNPGYYVFTNLGADQYLIEFDMPNLGGKQYYLTNANIGNDDQLDSDFTSAGGIKYRTSIIDFDPALVTDDFSFDAGIFRKGNIGNFVWNDTDQDGIQDNNEVGINGVTVTLRRSSDDALIATTTTSNNGSGSGKDGEYLFTGIDPGNYYIVFSDYDENGEDVYSVTSKNATSDDLDSDADSIDSHSSSIINVTLTSDESDLSFDLGLHKGAIGDLIWHDLDADGIKENGESGISGITVKLYKQNGTDYQGVTPITITTDTNGKYMFYDLDPGLYQVEVVRGNTYHAFTLKNNILNKDDLDSDGTYTLKTDTSAFISDIPLNAGEVDMSNDVGLYKFAKLGDKVWNDKNHDGLQNSDFNGDTEPGINGVTVTLTGTTKAGAPVTLIQSTSTLNSQSGSYLFDTLDPGDYTITFSSIAGYARTTQDVSANGFDTTDSDATVGGGNDGKTISYSLTSGTSKLTVDAGYFKARLGDYIWIDTNGDGIQNEATSNGLNGVTVELYQTTTDNLVATTVTKTQNAVAGYYYFEDLSAGDYYIKVVEPNTYHLTLKNQGQDTSKDSNCDPINGFSSIISLSTGDDIKTVDAGLYQYASVGDYVWIDKNYNGIQDNNELGINNVTITLLHADNSVVLDGEGNQCITTTTANNGVDGYYQFINVIPIPTTDYKIRFTLPTGYDDFTQYNIGSDAIGTDTDDSDANTTSGPGYGETVLFKLSSSESNQTFDAGVFQYASIGNFIYFDDNLDGRHTTDGDVAEGAVSGVELELYKKDSNDNFIKQTTIYKKNGITFDLVNGSSATTGIDGRYSFDKLVPGEYKVKIVTIPTLSGTHYLVTTKDVGGADHAENIDVNDSDFAEIGMTYTYESDSYIIESGEDEDDIDAGIYLENSIGDYIWRDSDRNGRQDLSEIPIQGVTVSLYKEAGVNDVLIGSSVTDVNGNYLFSHLYKNDYYIILSNTADYFVSLQNALNISDSTDSDINPTTFTSDTVTLSRNTQLRTLDAGLFKDVSVGNYVWLDYNGNGIQDTYVDINGNSTDDGVSEHLEKPIQGITVSIADTNGNVVNNSSNNPVNSVLTDVTGNYLFSHLLPGTYKIIFDANAVDYNANEFLVDNKPLFVTTATAPGSTLETDSDSVIYNSDPNVGIVTSVTLADSLSLMARRDIDTGFYQTGSIGDYVWIDENRNGLQDNTELPVKNVKLTLYNASNVKLADTQTDLNGYYQFNDLKPGEYSVKITLPIDYVLTYDHRGNNIELDSNFDTTTYIANHVILYSGQIMTGIDAGIYYSPKPAFCEIGDYIWFDSDKDAEQDVSEKGLSGIKVSLFDAQGTLLKTTSTDASGYYLFNELYPGTYTVKVDTNQVSKYVKTYDQDMNLDNTASCTVKAGDKYLSLDFGYASYTPAMTIDKTANVSEIMVQGTINYEIRIKNTGDIKLTDVTVKDPLLKLNLQIGTLDIGESRTVTGTYVATDKDLKQGSITNVAEADSNETDKVSDSVKVIVNEKQKELPPQTPQTPIITEVTPKTPTDTPEKERIFVLDNDVDSITVAQEPEHGTVTIDNAQQIIYIPDETFAGSDTIIIVAKKDDQEYIYEIDIQEEDIAETVLSELPKTGGIPGMYYFLFGGSLILLGINLRRNR